MLSRKTCAAISLLGIVCWGSMGCGPGGQRAAGGKKTVRIGGSDTMVNLAQAWAEAYKKSHPDVSVQVSGGGSGVGIANLIKGTTDIANSSREMKKSEKEAVSKNAGQEPQEFEVGKDALAVYVHKDNPLEVISMADLAEIYGEHGKITKWSQLGVANKLCGSDEITRVSRQNNSGTYQYFREAVLTGQEYKAESVALSGSKDLVAMISRTPCAIGYSGMGYHTAEVKWLKVAQQQGDSGVEPSVDTVQHKTYPISRPLFMYTRGEPAGEVKEFLDWVRSEAGQKVVIDLGYVPLHAAATGEIETVKTSEEPAEEKQ
ncbi:MAG: phosphate ABC transporter substrate-binding protein [Planctomycetota bacterium]|nr:phosphate ABC transporter substrate-binding protein [Planctomycetota bacterium]